jgi:POT family proton-dependent oligopeptide transporter
MHIREILGGFQRPFWVANFTEIFERLSYYTVFAALVPYLINTLGLPTAVATTLGGIFGGAVWVMAAFGGALADRIGFRRALSVAYFILTCAYFLVGSIGAPWLAPVRSAVPLWLLAGFILLLPSLGVALVKPSVVGTTARASSEQTRSIGYSIYYTMVNIGSFCGPILAGWVHSNLPTEDGFLLAALSVFLMMIVVLVFFKEPRATTAVKVPTLGEVSRNFLTVIGNWRFSLFLLIFSGYWFVYWQQWLILSTYVTRYIDGKANPDYFLSTDPVIVILFTVLMNLATRKLTALRAIVFGSLITSVSYLVIIVHADMVFVYLALAVLAIGEIMQSPRYYEYISRLAPEGQQGTYLGFAFLPIGIGALVGGPVGGMLLHYFGEVQRQPATVWFIVTGVGLLTTALLWIYDKTVKPPTQAAT